MSTLQHPSPSTEPVTARAHEPGPSSLIRARASGRAGTQKVGDARDAVRRAVIDALDGPGAVILGAAGTGKSTLARESVGDYGGFSVQLRGSTLSAQTPYGALAWLLSDLPQEQLANPVLVVRALETLLVHQAGGRRIILVIDNAEEIDDLGVLVTAELCRRGTAALLLVCGDLIRCHEEYVRLWTDGSLERIDLAPLDLARTGELLAASAGGPLTSLAQHLLWRHSKGNPLLASLLCRDHIGAGSLVHRRGYWTWAGPLVHSGELPERVETVLRRFTPEERRAVEILALCRQLPVTSVLQLVPAHTVDALEEASVLIIGGGLDQPVRLAWDLQPATIAARVPFGRSRDLWSEVTRVVDPRAFSGETAAGLAAWSLSVGVAADHKTSVAAANWANKTGDTNAALRYARAVAEPRTLAAIMEEADALRAEGRHAQAYRLLAAVEERENAGAELRLRALAARALSAARTPSSPDSPEQLLDRAGSLLPKDTGARPGPRVEVTLARAELLSIKRRYRDLPSSLAEDFADPAIPPSSRLWAGIRWGQQCAAAGRFSEAVSVVAQIRDRLSAGIDTDARTRELLFHHLFFLLIRCGELETALNLTLATVEHRESSGLVTPTGIELPLGMVHAFAGRSDAALKFLQPAVAQLESHDPDDTLPLAAAAAAYCARQRREPDPEMALPSVPDSRGRTDPSSVSEVRYFRILASFSDEPNDAAVELHRFGVDERAAGDIPNALLGFSAAAIRGNRAAMQDLKVTAAAADGAPAYLYGHLARGLLTQDVTALILAAEAALRQQNSLLGHGAAHAARVLGDGRATRALVRRARQLEYEGFRSLSPVNSVEYGLAQLGDFERDLVLRAAAGETSAALGRRFHLSARTVDWHLGRVFTRLHVSGRTDLRNALALVTE